jgi:uncharacterized repeat protein (TIGR01451 family)
MNKLTTYRRFILVVIAILPLILSPLSSNAAFAATSRADISITLVADKSNVKMGQNITYTAFMTNHGPDDAAFVDVSFSWPGQLNLVSMTCDQGISPDTPNCEYSALAAGKTVVSKLVATPAPGAPTHEKLLTVTANVLFEVDCKFDPNCTFDPHLRNNSARANTKLIGQLVHH